MLTPPSPNDSVLNEDIEVDPSDPLSDFSGLLPESTPFDEAPALFNIEDSKKFADWMAGIEKEPPEVLNRMISTIAVKLSWAMSYMIMDILVRMHSMSRMLRKIENEISNRDLRASELSELTVLYRTTSDSQVKSLEFVRRFIVQNKEQMTRPDVDEVYELLLTKSPKELLRIKKAIQGAQSPVKETSDT